MPWKGEKDPYKIWLSEIILQQTRVDQGLKYYERFINDFPNIHMLANSPDQEIYKRWEGLGYYTRCRNLIETAKYVSKALDGKFPDHFEEIRKLKGIGPYTAAAIASFAFNERHAVLDGNVYRVLSRIFGVSQPIDSIHGKTIFKDLAKKLLAKKKPGLYNQAIMDFGAVICKPVPLCSECPFNKYCFAYRNNKISALPVKLKKTALRKRWFYYVLLEHKGKLAIQQRIKKDIWNNLFEFLLIESDSALVEKELLRKAKNNNWVNIGEFEILEISSIYRQRLSHQLIEGRFAHLKIKRRPKLEGAIFWIDKAEVKNYALPRFINQYLEAKEDQTPSLPL